MGIDQCPLIVRSCKWLDIRPSIRTSQDVLRYLGTHWHQWWVCLALVNNIHQWSVIQWLLFMLDINTFIRMTRIVPSCFIVGEDYTFPFASTVTTTWFYLRLPQFHFLPSTFSWFDSNNCDSFPSDEQYWQFYFSWSCSSDIFHAPTTTSTIFLLHSSSSFLGKWRYVVF